MSDKLAALVCPDCGRERSEAGCRNWMDCMNSMRDQLRDLRAKLSASEAEVARLKASESAAINEMAKARRAAMDAQGSLDMDRLIGMERADEFTSGSLVKRLYDHGKQLEQEVARLRQEVEDIAYLDAAACRGGTRLGIPAKLPGFDPGDADHIHFVMVPIGAAARHAAVAWLKAKT